ncbi:hypothetical protein GGI22_006747, partial [Coemansia erecta]
RAEGPAGARAEAEARGGRDAATQGAQGEGKEGEGWHGSAGVGGIQMESRAQEI